jgi:IrrE N-terminal-like domain
VDVFSVIEAEGIRLMFQPLRDLFGFYRRLSGVAGIVIDANHPPSLQRYTAAHEYGHHVLGHGFSLDEVRNIDGARGVDAAREFEEALAVKSPAEIGDPRHEAAAQVGFRRDIGDWAGGLLDGCLHVEHDSRLGPHAHVEKPPVEPVAGRGQVFDH